MQETEEKWVLSLGLEDPGRRKRQPTPVFSPGESHGQTPGRLQPMGRKELHVTEATQHSTWTLTAVIY